MLSLRHLAKVVLLAGLGVPSRAAAATPEELTHADSLFKEGLRLFETGQTDRACGKFDESYKLDPALGTLQNLAICHEKQGKLVLAYGEFSELQIKAQAAGKAARIDTAREHLGSLDSKVARVVLSFGDLTAATVEIDGTRRDWHASIPVDMGHHVITAHTPDRPDARVEWDASTPGAHTLPIVFPPPPRQVVPPPPPAPPPPPSSGLSQPLVFTFGGVGAAGMIAGSIFGILTFTQKSAGDSHCAGQYCDSVGLSSENAAHTSATISTIAFGVGLAALGASALLLLTSGLSPEASVKHASNGAGLTMHF